MSLYKFVTNIELEALVKMAHLQLAAKIIQPSITKKDLFSKCIVGETTGTRSVLYSNSGKPFTLEELTAKGSQMPHNALEKFLNKPEVFFIKDMCKFKDDHNLPVDTQLKEEHYRALALYIFKNDINMMAVKSERVLGDLLDIGLIGNNDYHTGIAGKSQNDGFAGVYVFALREESFTFYKALDALCRRDADLLRKKEDFIRIFNVAEKMIDYVARQNNLTWRAPAEGEADDVIVKNNAAAHEIFQASIRKENVHEFLLHEGGDIKAFRQSCKNVLERKCITKCGGATKTDFSDDTCAYKSECIYSWFCYYVVCIFLRNLLYRKLSVGEVNYQAVNHIDYALFMEKYGGIRVYENKK
jgi:hypothetical protein